RRGGGCEPGAPVVGGGGGARGGGRCCGGGWRAGNAVTGADGVASRARGELGGRLEGNMETGQEARHAG
ncbi:hypothetical protein DWU95_46085, partial [Burkholderia contaminans]